MRYILNRFVHIIAIVLLATGARSQSPPPDHVVSVPVANMYSRATDDSEVVSQAIVGMNVVTIDSQEDWAKVRTADGYAGWISAAVLRPLRDSHPYATSEATVQVESLFANLYRETDVTAGSGNDAGWMEVRLPDQSRAWIQSGDVVRDP